MLIKFGGRYKKLYFCPTENESISVAQESLKEGDYFNLQIELLGINRILIGLNLCLGEKVLYLCSPVKRERRSRGFGVESGV